MSIRISEGRPGDAPEATTGQTIFVALFLLLGSGMLAWAGWTRRRELHVPPAIAYVVALVFFVAAMAVVLKRLGYGEKLDPLVLVIMGSFTVIDGWIALFGDPRRCSASGPLWLPLPGCRLGFGVAALFSAFFTWIVLVVWLRKLRRRPGAHPASPGHR